MNGDIDVLVCYQVVGVDQVGMGQTETVNLSTPIARASIEEEDEKNILPIFAP